jgi:hypothetical protein
MNSLFLTTVLFLLASKGSHAQFPDGNDILEQEAKRINELNELEHQVKIMEQKSKIIKAQKEIDNSQEKNIFLDAKNEKFINDQVKSLPELISIDGNGFAGFQTKYGKILAKKGDVIPGNFRVDQVSIDHGVIVSKSGRSYSLDMSW